MAEDTHSLEGEGSLRRIFTGMMEPERRALFGTLLFFIAILGIGWAAINEGQRMTLYTDQFAGRSIERGAVLYSQNCSTCHGVNGEGIPGVGRVLNTPAMYDGTRLAEVGWTGTTYDFIYLTVNAGRPVKSSPEWANAMPTWGQEYGGPMREDQVRDVVNFVMNWGAEVDEVAAFIPPTPTPLPFPVVGNDVEAALAALSEVEGAATRGEALFLGQQNGPDGRQLGCQACHSIDGSVLVGPSMQGFGERYATYNGDFESVDWYLVDSIIRPADFKVPGFEAVVMPENFGTERLDAQALADLIAYIKTFQ